jgi:alpha-tubulin suppressor-like RCC1 family protein
VGAYSERMRGWILAGLGVAVGCGGRTGLEGWAVERSAGGSVSFAGSFARGGRAAAAGGSGGGAQGGNGFGGVAGSRGGATGQAGIGGASGAGGSAGGAAGDAGRTGTGGVAGAGGSAGVAGGSGAGAGGIGGIGGIGGGSAGSAGLDGEGGEGGEATRPPDATTLALGAFHTCTGFVDGSLRCWGSAGYIGDGNELTIGDDEPPSVIPPVSIGGSVLSMAAGWYHTCVVLTAGNLRCFGVAADGRLGYASLEDIGDDETPASAGDVDLGGAVTQVSAGPSHSCARLESGAVRCWGESQNYALGYPSLATIGDDETPASAGDVDVGGPVLQVVVGGNHSCALLDDGTVRCWGNGTGGRLGYGNAETVGDDESPAQAGNLDLGGQAVALAAGLLHTCALLSTGTVRCWGPGNYGVLGYGTQEAVGDDETPAQVGDVDVGGAVVQIAAGDFATCALLVGGTVRCWGRASEGELGYGNGEDIGDDETPASAGDLELGAPATAIDVGFLHACAILETGAVRCWGRAQTGALGYGNIEDLGDDETPASAGDVPAWP